MEVRVLGPVELLDGAATVRLPPAERTVLAALASRLGERVAVDVLVEALWPNKAPPSARKTLQVYVVRLRRAIGAATIVERGGGYLLDPDGVAVDATRITTMLGTARELLRSGDAETALGLFLEATAVFRGEPYEGVPDEALPAGEVARLQELRLSVTEETAEARLACGRGEQCIAELETLVQACPYRERAWALLMRALYQAGRPADALAAYGRARLVLAAELGIEPGPALREIEQAILTHDPGLGGGTTAPVRLAASNVPTPVSPLVGRDLELATLDPLAPGQRLVTLTGVGGIGKTRLAIEIASNVSGHFECGPYFVDLSSIRDVELVPTALAAALGINVEPGADVLATIRTTVDHRAFIVVVDNCEHLLPGVADVVSTVVTSNPRVHVLATSREPLGVAGERVCPIDPLRVPPTDASIEQIETSDAAVMFLARLPMNLTTAPLSAGELAAVGTICRHLDGIPLGLELAAALSRTLSLADLAARLRHSIDELAPSRHGVPPRHRTMRAALDWGYQLLSPPAQSALRAMSVFAGGCDLDAFTTVCVEGNDPPAVDVLDELVRTSYVTVDFATNSTRYRLLEPVRQHAHQLLNSEETAERHRRHLEFYLKFARDHTSDIDEPGGHTDFDVLNIEFGNFRAALDWSAANPDGTEAGLRLVARLNQLRTTAVHHAEGLSRTIGLLSSRGGSAAARSEAAYSAGFIAYDLGEIKQSEELFERALTEAQVGHDRVGQVRARRVLANGAVTAGDIGTSRLHLERAIPMALEEGDHLLYAHCVATLANVLCLIGDLDEAEEHIGEILGGTIGSVSSVDIWAQRVLGRVMFERANYERARACMAKIVDLTGSGPDLDLVLVAHLELAKIECAAGNADDAAVHIARAAGLLPDTSLGWDPDFALAQAELALLRGDWAHALANAERVDAITEQRGDVMYRCDILPTLGDAQLALGRPDDAVVTFDRLIDLATGRFACRCAEGHEGAAAVAAALNRVDHAWVHLETATKLRKQTGSQRVRRPTVEHYLMWLGTGPYPVATGANVSE